MILAQENKYENYTITIHAQLRPVDVIQGSRPVLSGLRTTQGTQDWKPSMPQVLATSIKHWQGFVLPLLVKEN